MLSKEISAWAKLFFYNSMHIPIASDYQFDESEEDNVLRLYAEEFTKPVSYMLYGSVLSSIPQEDVNKFLPIMRACKLPNVVHYLSVLVNKGYFVYTGDVQKDLSDAVAKLKENEKECYIMAHESQKPVIGYVDKGNTLLGTFAQRGIIVLGETRRFPKGLDLEHLCQQDPIRLTDFGINVLRTLVNAGKIQEGYLNKSKYIIPELDGTFKEVFVNAMTPQLPSYFVRKLISELPEATLANAESPYHAALEFAEQHPDEYRTALRELRDIIDNATIPSAAGLTDDIVLEYLHNKFGIPKKTLRETIMVPTTEKLYTSAYFLGEAVHTMSAEEFIDKATEDPMAVSGTLDELLLAFCKEEKFDANLSVNQLIAFINDEEIDYSPAISEVSLESVREYLATYLKNTGTSEETTLAEFISDTKHKYRDDAAIAMDLISDMDCIDDDVRSDIIDAIKLNKPLSYPDLFDQLSELKLPDTLTAAIMTAKQTGNDFASPELTTEDVVTYLVRLGIPRVDASTIATGKIPQPEEKDISQQIFDALRIHYSEPDVTSILQGTGLTAKKQNVEKMLSEWGIRSDLIEVILNENDSQIVNNLLHTALTERGFDEETVSNILVGKSSRSVEGDKGYTVAESLLYDMRTAIHTNDSEELRSSLLPIIYSYMRILMMKQGDEEDVIDFLHNKKKECKGVAVGFIDTAISKLT